MVKLDRDDNFRGLTLGCIDDILVLDELCIDDGTLRWVINRVIELKEDLEILQTENIK